MRYSHKKLTCKKNLVTVMQQFVPAFILDRFARHEQMEQFPAIVLGLDISSFTSLAEKLSPYR